jgi:hypothetical protein
MKICNSLKDTIPLRFSLSLVPAVPREAEGAANYNIWYLSLDIIVVLGNMI